MAAGAGAGAGATAGAWRTAALVAVGGAAGGAARYGLAVALPAGPGDLPLSTLLADWLGCLLLGLLIGARPHSPVLRPLLGTGALGGFTTFSALALQTDRLLADAPAVAVLHLALTTGGGLLLAAVGLRAGGRARR